MGTTPRFRSSRQRAEARHRQHGERQRHSVFDDFLAILDSAGFHFTDKPGERLVYCPDYGIPQHRHRIVLLASKLGPIDLIPPTCKPDKYPTVRAAISKLQPLRAGSSSSKDRLHRSSILHPINKKRMAHSTPGGTWRDWPEELIAECHRSESGYTYPSVYGRMEWDKPSPTITTQFFGYGNGRFGHPKQNRALSLREGALLQSFPNDYEFVASEDQYCFKSVGRMIGNAVPVRLGEVVGLSIRKHLEKYAK